MSYGTPLSITLPTIDGVFTEAQAAPLINACFNTIKARLEELVSPASMDINADLSFRSGADYFGAKELHRVSLNANGSPINATTYPNAIYVVGDDFYYNDASGNQIQITNNGEVNISVSGGITGSGYGTGGVEVNWDAGNTRYRMRSGNATDDFAAVMSDDILLVDDSGNAIRLGSPSAISADYTCLLPSAVPAANDSMLLMSTAGAMSHTRTPTMDSFTAVSGGHMTVSGSGRFKHGEMKQVVGAAGGVAEFGSVALTASAFRWDFSGAGVMIFPVTLPVGARVTEIEFLVIADGTGDKTMQFVSLDPGTVTPTTHETSTFNSDLGGNFVMVSLSISPAVTITDDTVYTALYGSDDAGDSIAGIQITYDYP